MSVSRRVTTSWSSFAYVTKFDRCMKRKHRQVFWVIQITLLLSLRTLHKYSSGYSTLKPTSYITCGKAAKIQLVLATYKRFTIVFVRCICVCKHDEMTKRVIDFSFIFFYRALHIVTLHALREAVLRCLLLNIKD